MSIQVNIRLDDALVEAIDGWTVIRGISRPQLIREAIEEYLRRHEDERVAQQYRQAYSEHPESGEEMRRAAQNARRAISEEPWDRPW